MIYFDTERGGGYDFMEIYTIKSIMKFSKGKYPRYDIEQTLDHQNIIYMCSFRRMIECCT